MSQWKCKYKKMFNEMPEWTKKMDHGDWTINGPMKKIKTLKWI